MDNNILVVEKPEIPGQEDVSVMDEAAADLGRYLANNLGYYLLQNQMADRKIKTRKREKKIALASRLPIALIELGINVYSKVSVEKYKRTALRWEYAKALFGTNGVAWFFMSFVAPTVFATLSWLGHMSESTAITLGLIPVLITAHSAYVNFKLKNIDGLSAFFMSAMCSVSFCLMCLGILLWSPFIMIGWIFSMATSGAFKDDVGLSDIRWNRRPISRYSEEIPLFALETARQIHERFPSAVFIIEELGTDPFLIVKDRDTGEEYYVAVWGERAFEAEN